MRRHIEGLHNADQFSVGVFPDGLFLVRVERAQYRWRAQKPHYALRLQVLEPKELAGALDRRTPLLHSESAMEAQLVPAGFRL